MTLAVVWRWNLNLSVERMSTHFFIKWSAWSREKACKGFAAIKGSAKVQARASQKMF